MADGVGLSVGATNLAAVVVGRTALMRSPVLTRFAHRPPEVGVPSQNPNLNERGLILTDFVDRVGDPVGIVAADGSTHRADAVLADALLAMLVAVGGGRPPAGPVAVTHPAHWRPAAIEALRGALADKPEFGSGKAVPVVSDATAALTALQDEPGLPTRGIVALCDFGGTGSAITLVDAGNGFAAIAPTVRHTDLSGDLVDQALLTHVIEDLSAAGTIDLSGTSAIGSLSRLRAQCRGAKERLSTAGFTTLVADLPGRRSDVRLTRTELDDVIRQPLADFADTVADTLHRNGIRGADLSAVASVGGGALIPIITTTLSERFRVPVITNGQPDLAAAIGGGLAAVRGTVEEGMTALSAAPGVAAAAAAATAMAPEVPPPDEVAQSGSFNALAWSDADDVPDVAPTDPYDYSAPGAGGAADVRPQMHFGDDSWHEVPPRAVPWYRNPAVAMGAGVLTVLVALIAAVVWVMSDDSLPAPASTTAPPITATPRPATPAQSPDVPPPATQAPPPRTVYQAPPPATQTRTAPPSSPEPPPPPPPSSEPPPPPPPPPTSEPPPPPPTSEPPPTTQPPPWSPTAPYPTIPGLPWVPAPQLPGQPPGP
ncbi:Hsp70 family protein [Mycobacterium sp. IDR2000157661]|uniref:Hsp70 family protein n=1 Tax=Mycobacterium sp. IDR2000157661 TaxID=2867005 RepID=UPI001EEA67BF|nr:Hsp70 family protein [Mycobacterium sp. IDR2000157661]ULE32007.1 Hsp70 family protein [Mycobacterium sp. IDR2000157661]